MSDKKRAYELNPRGHVWKTYDDGVTVDFFGYDEGENHNGPICVKCGYGFCRHCRDLPEHDCPK